MQTIEMKQNRRSRHWPLRASQRRGGKRRVETSAGETEESSSPKNASATENTNDMKNAKSIADRKEVIQSSPLLNLPIEIFSVIVEISDTLSLTSLRLTCRKMRETIPKSSKAPSRCEMAAIVGLLEKDSPPDSGDYMCALCKIKHPKRYFEREIMDDDEETTIWRYAALAPDLLKRDPRERFCHLNIPRMVHYIHTMDDKEVWIRTISPICYHCCGVSKEGQECSCDCNFCPVVKLPIWTRSTKFDMGMTVEVLRDENGVLYARELQMRGGMMLFGPASGPDTSLTANIEYRKLPIYYR